MLQSAEKSKEKKPISKRKASRKHLEEKIRNQSPVNEFVEGEIVLGTIPGYSPWPARIISITHETILIEFSGTGEV